MSNDDMTKAQKAGFAGFCLCLLAFAIFVAGMIFAAFSRNVAIATLVSSIPVLGVGLYLLGHPPGEGPAFMREGEE